MMDSIGRFSVGRSAMIGKKRKYFFQKTVQQMVLWRNKARINLFRLRERYKQKVKSNQALMKYKKTNKIPNLNPTAVVTTLGDKPKSRQYEITYSTVPLKPKYSTVKPAERIYGNRWKLKR